MDGIESILTSVKKSLGIEASYKQFDMDIILAINTVFSVLTQLGVGPETGFSIQDEEAEWTDFIEEDPRFEMIKTYVYLRVRLLFDPPSSSFVVDAFKNQISELEWRIQVAAEPYDLLKSGGCTNE